MRSPVPVDPATPRPAEEGNPLWGEGWEAVRAQWLLDPDVVFLNHGSFGACPVPVLDAQAGRRQEMEGQPVEYLWRRLPGLLAEARAAAAAFLGADPDGFVFVPNATTGVSTVLASVGLRAGDRVVITDHVYPAVHHAVRRACAAAGATVVVAPVPLPPPPAAEIADTLAAASDGARLAVVEHVTSPTGLVLPVERIVPALRDRGTLVLVDAAHAPGMLPVDVGALAADFWTGNFHKWVCAPKGSAALVVGPDRRQSVRPLVTSHGAEGPLHSRFDWVGTADYTPYLCVPHAIAFLDELGWERVCRHNHELAALGQSVVSRSLGTDPPIPTERFGAMSLVALPDGIATTQEEALRLQARLYEAHRIEVPFVAWGERGFLRLSAQVHNRPDDYRRLAEALPGIVG